MDNVKSINSLMAYMRDEHNIAISGSSQKIKLKNIGYYHGYKGYRYIANPSNKIPYSDFSEILAINNFDMKLKANIYPQIMFIETALKNYVLEVVLDKSNSSSFNTIYNKLLTDYKSCSVGSKNYKESLSRRLRLQDKIYSTLTKSYSNDKKVVVHFYNKDINVPIWAIFEVLNLGDFGTFVSCLEGSVKKQISINLGLNQACDSNGKLTQSIIYTLKDLRNSVAHNDIIFDTRFKSGYINSSLTSCVQQSTGITNVTFNSILDYIILISYVLKILNVSKTEINSFINEFVNSVEGLRKQIPINIYNRIIHTNTRNKIIALKQYVKL